MEQLHFITKLLDIKDPIKFLTLKRLVCLLEFSLENVVLSAIIA
ncbi:transposase [Streptococcus pneumoniae GA06083]|nr:transposase [Streptococcus pneumoniae 4027-06]EHD31639.1 ribonuclease III [Streptococcus pneumoniae GA11184]EHD32333.1 transposase [Streptococcus pneumoniae 6735-05]EHD43220.1 transposase [Streptococcus pneumoniae GA43265]EHD50830.1 transposase [Streptococcus pneumoniae 6901-05]EHD58459.1 transposase [Streptococcus pneumoniae NP070]EHD59525.1 transposase [Streptococcus pneumoniae GA44500]EHD66575.1 transposase [Streptococcus pneumoniae 5787-06]EHD70532.1 transposase [Streptococcus pneumo